MDHDRVRSVSNDRPNQPPAWVFDVLSDLQKVADKRGMVRLSEELRGIRSQFPPPSFEK